MKKTDLTLKASFVRPLVLRLIKLGYITIQQKNFKKRLFSFMRYFMDWKLQTDLFISRLGLKSPLHMQTKSAVIPRYEKSFILRLISSHHEVYEIFYFTLNQQSSWSMVDFLFYGFSAAIPKCKENIFWKNIQNFFRVDFFVFRPLQVLSWNIRIFFLKKRLEIF